MDIFQLLWFGCLGGIAALGFAMLFTVPKRTLIYIFFLGVLGIIVKKLILLTSFEIFFASFAAATLIGVLSMFFAHKGHAPPLVFSIPAVIPLVPGSYFYKFMIGVIDLIGVEGTGFTTIFSETVNNGLSAIFVIMGLSVGVSLPNLVFRKESFHETSFFKMVKKKNKP